MGTSATLCVIYENHENHNHGRPPPHSTVFVWEKKSHEGRTYNPTQIIGFPSICLYDYNNSKTEHTVTAAFLGSLQVTVHVEKRDVSHSVCQHLSNNVSKCLFFFYCPV